MSSHHNSLPTLGFVATLFSPLLIILAACFLPFTLLKYRIQRLEPHVSNTIEVGEEELSLEVHLFRCLGGICGKQKVQVEAKMTEVLTAGNNAPVSLHPTTQDNHLINKLNSLSRGLATLFGDDDNMKEKLQVRVFAYAGVLVILILLAASVLATLSLLFVALRGASSKAKQVVTSSKEVISCLLLCATILYPATTWTQMSSSGSSLGPDYIVLAMLTTNVYLGSLIIRGFREVVKYVRRKQKQPPMDFSLSSLSETSVII